MIKIKHGSNQGHGPISQKVLSGIEKIQKRKVIDLSQFKEARLSAENLDKTVITDKEMAALDPVHAVYVYAQNKISVLSEQLGELPELSKLLNAIADAQEEYMPSFPPMSPLTTSYFTCWGFFDLTTGIKRETFGTITIDLCRALGVDKSLVTIFQLMQDSRMGFYVHEGVSAKYVWLRELVTGRKIKAISPSGYLGEAGQIWYARIMPEPFPEIGYGYDVVFATPYVIMEMAGSNKLSHSNEKKWMEFFERNLPKTNTNNSIAAYEFFMKYGLSRQQMNYRRPGMHYWNEYVFEGYVSHQDDMIILAGYPDIPLRRPHSNESEVLRGE
jgi:hypothetical protein